MRQCEVQKNKSRCNCSYEPCSRKGICCECLEYHWNMGQFPACFFPKEAERTYNRSVENFIKTYQKRGPWW